MKQQNIEDTTAERAQLPDLELVQRCARQAESAIKALWDDSRQTFWRSTEHRERDEYSKADLFFPTVSFRCANALMSLVSQAPEWASKDTRRQLVERILPRLVSLKDRELRSTLDVEDKLNIFTLSVYVGTFAQICQLHVITGAAASDASKQLQSAAAELISHGSLRRAGRRDFVPIHPFILYTVAHSLQTCLPHLKSASRRAAAAKLIRGIAIELRASVERLLAKHSLGALAPSESVALAFCAGALLCTGMREDLPYVLTSLSMCLESQDASGAWPLGRVVRENKDVTTDKLEIPMFEIAAVIANTIHELFLLPITEAEHAQLLGYFNRLVRSAHYAERSRVHLSTKTSPQVGWCTDHAYGSELIESWTSAGVLLLMLSLRKLLEEAHRREILKAFVTVSPADRDWPDWLRWQKYRDTNETDHSHPVLRYLDERVIKPILADPRGLPAIEPRSVSVLLFGPPGTAKTTLVKAVADGLQWPVIMLSPGNFIERGLEYIEAQAKSVFDRLLDIPRAVVLFDECDELFRERKPIADTEQTRGITAFVTASMLPKLQDLHDRGRVVFFICTNNFASMDSAVKRGGRVDHIIGIGPPDTKARKVILEQWLEQARSRSNGSVPPHLEQALQELSTSTARFIRSELLRAADLLQSDATSWKNADDARAGAAKAVAQLQPGLTISADEFTKYCDQRSQVSRPAIEGFRK